MLAVEGATPSTGAGRAEEDERDPHPTGARGRRGSGEGVGTQVAEGEL